MVRTRNKSKENGHLSQALTASSTAAAGARRPCWCSTRRLSQRDVDIEPQAILALLLHEWHQPPQLSQTTPGHPREVRRVVTRRRRLPALRGRRRGLAGLVVALLLARVVLMVVPAVDYVHERNKRKVLNEFRVWNLDLIFLINEYIYGIILEYMELFSSLWN